MQLNFVLSKKLKWFLIGFAALIGGMGLFYLGGGGDNPGPLPIFSVFLMIAGGLMMGGMVMAWIVTDMEDDY